MPELTAYSLVRTVSCRHFRLSGPERAAHYS